MAKSKKPRSAKQLANDERLRNRKKKTEDDQEFVPTEVKEKQEAEAAQADQPVMHPAATDETVPVDNTPSQAPPMPATPVVDPNLVATIVAAMAAIQQNPQYQQMTPDQKIEQAVAMNPNAARVSQANGVQGIVYRYNVDPNHYPDPTGRLLDEPRLRRFAMRENYRFRWEVTAEQFEKHGITYAEPRFTLELFRLLYDEEGMPTGSMALVARQIQHEDDFVVRSAAVRLGLQDQFGDDDEGFRQLRDEIRYWRIQQWLFGIFTPPKIQTFRKQPKSQVIAGKVVEVYDTEILTDHDSGVAAADTIQSQAGVGKIATPTVKG